MDIEFRFRYSISFPPEDLKDNVTPVPLTATHICFMSHLLVLVLVLVLLQLARGKSGPALGGTEYRLMPSACRLIVRAKL